MKIYEQLNHKVKIQNQMSTWTDFPLIECSNTELLNIMNSEKILWVQITQ